MLRIAVRIKSRLVMIYDKDQHIAELEATVQALSSKLAELNKRQMARNNEQSLKWRNKAFYYKKQLDRMKDQLIQTRRPNESLC